MNQRFYSLDVFRGAAVALMILVNNPGDWGHIFTPLEHANWNGCTPTDLVFPFFLFAVGNALAFVMPRLEAKNIFWRKVFKRTVLIFLIGLFLNWFPFVQFDEAGHLTGKPFENLRFFGVLQRIALSYFFAAVIVHFLRPKGSLVLAIIILFLYWLLCYAANPADPFSIDGWFGTRIDKMILGESHMYHGEGRAFDPEGLVSLPGAVVQVMLGYIAGNYIRLKGKTPEMLNGLFVAGALLMFIGYAWDMGFPINKKIWTSSFTVYTTGAALLILSVMIFFIEFKKVTGAWTSFCDVFGKNALFVFTMSGVLPRLMGLIRIPNGSTPAGKPSYLTPFGWFFEHICKPLFPLHPRIGSLLYALCFIALMWSFAWYLNRRKIYIKV